MTQTATKATTLSYDALHEKFQTNFPQLVTPLEQAKEKLDRGEGAQELANIISCEVQVREEHTGFVYTWTGQKGQAFEYRVLKPFDPTPEHQPQVAQEAAELTEVQPTSQEPSGTATKVSVDAQASDEVQEAPVAVAEQTKPDIPQPEPEAKTPPLAPGLFSALAELLGENTLLMTLAKHDDDLTVNVMPFGDDKDTSISAICLSGTPAELDEGFIEAIHVKVASRKSLAEQVAALKAAEKELADAKKAEADAKRAEGEKKKKAAEAKKKQAEERKEQKLEAAEKAGKQEGIF